MRAGNLDRKIDIQRRALSSSNSGEPTEVWTNLVVGRAASVRPARGDERAGQPQEAAHEQLDIWIRYSANVADLSPLDRIIYPTLRVGETLTERRILDILAVQEIGRREVLQIIAQRRVDAS